MFDTLVFQEFIHFLLSPLLGLNWLDFLLLGLCFFYAIEGFGVGAVVAFIDFVKFVVSFISGLLTYKWFSGVFVVLVGLSQGFANAAGFFLATFVFEIILSITTSFFLRRFFFSDQFSEEITTGKYVTSKAFGVFFGLSSAFVLLSFLLTVVIVLPFAPSIKQAVFTSKIASNLVVNVQGFEHRVDDIFGGAVHDSLTFVTVEPKSHQVVYLRFKTEKYQVDSIAEYTMVQMVNQERTKRGIAPLSIDQTLQFIARTHCEDMFKRGYFSHDTPEGISPFDRMGNASVTFNFAGENLALAPNVALAMQGLMNSKGHRANILNPEFKRIGIGVLDGGIYGEMFAQEFTD